MAPERLSRRLTGDSFGETVEPPAKRLFMSHQHTTRSVERVASLLEGDSYFCVASMPPFNGHAGCSPPEGTQELNVPCFGPLIANRLLELFEGDSEVARDISAVAETLRVKLPPYAFSTFVHGKAKKVWKLVEKAREREDCKEESNDGVNFEALRKLEQFLVDFEALKPEVVQSLAQWKSFMTAHVPGDWEGKLHFDHILGLFGFEASTAMQLRKTEIEDEGKPATLESFSLRWLSKAFSAYGPVGCLVDAVNLIYAMLGKLDVKDQDQWEVVASIAEFKEKLEGRNWASLWTPTHLVFDCELDDMMCWILLKYVSRLKGETPTCVAQLPPGDAFDDIEASLSARGVEVFRDSDSNNGKAILESTQDFFLPWKPQ